MKMNVVTDYEGVVPQDAQTMVDQVRELCEDPQWNDFTAIPIDFTPETKALLGQTAKKYLRKNGFNVEKVRNQPILLIYRPPEDFVPTEDEDEDEE